MVATRLRGRLISGYGGRSAPPFDRYYMGGEDDVRGFSSWAVSPIAFLPSAATIPELNPDGSARYENILVNCVLTAVPVTMSIPVYRTFSPGGDTNVVANFEYRIPVAGPLTFAIFTDAGVNRITFDSQLKLNQGIIGSLNGKFIEAGYSNRLLLVPAAQKIRMSTGPEL